MARTENPQQAAMDGVAAILIEMEIFRAKIASYYVTVNANDYPVVEHEVGECLTAVREAVARLRKAKGVLAQEALPGMGRDTAA